MIGHKNCCGNQFTQTWNLRQRRLWWHRVPVISVLTILFIVFSSQSATAQAPVCGNDPTCTPNTGASSYAGAVAARASVRNARGYSGAFVPRTSLHAAAGVASSSETVVGSQSYNYAIPILQWPGRVGNNLALNLYYNSRIMDVDTVNSTVTFNADRDFPSYGFRLDFGYIESSSAGSVLTEGDGTKRALVTPEGLGYSQTTDGSNIVFGLTGTGRRSMAMALKSNTSSFLRTAIYGGRCGSGTPTAT